MEKYSFVNTMVAKLDLDTAEAELILNEILALQVLPDPFRSMSIQRIAAQTSLDAPQAEKVVNHFVGFVTDKANLFEEVIRGFASGAACRSCNCCAECSIDPV